MRRHLRASLFSLLGLAAVTACGSAATQSAAGTATNSRVSQRPDDHGLRGPLLWEVQGRNGPSYLFGTIHAGFQADRELPAWVWDKLEACDTFVMEADIEKLDVMEMTRLASLPDGKSLSDMLEPGDWRALLDLTGLPESSLRTRQPWFAVTLVLQRLYPTPVPLDLALLQRAQKQGKEVQFLEELRFQLELVTRTTTVDDLRDLLGEDGKGRRQLAQLLAAYREGDFEEIGALTEESLAGHPERYDMLLSARNRDWIPKLEPHLARGRTFVAVGAGHFAGDDGLIELLRAEGFILTRRVAARP
jgi:uncharacterized protein YbaP (TraB family)